MPINWWRSPTALPSPGRPPGVRDDDLLDVASYASNFVLRRIL